MKNTVFTGAGVALITPMLPDGQVNYDGLRALIDDQIANGTDAIVACGTTGESPTLSHEEHTEVIRVAVEQTAGRVPLIAGTGSNDTAYALRLCQEAEALGADALLMVTPYYNKSSQKGLIQHYTYIADRVNSPIILYNVPGRTGCNLTVATYQALAPHPNIAAIKEASGDVTKVAETMAVCGDLLDIYSGNDDQILPILALGGAGVISVLSNIVPRQTHDLCARFFAGDLAGARCIQLDMMELIGALFCDVNPIPVKEAMNLMGMQVGACRLPLTDMDEAGRERMRRALKNAGLI